MLPYKYRPSTVQATQEVKRIIYVLNGEMKRIEIQKILNLKHKGNFRDNYLIPCLENELIEMSIPDKPNSSKQKYRLTAKGLKLKKTIKLHSIPKKD